MMDGEQENTNKLLIKHQFFHAWLALLRAEEMETVLLHSGHWYEFASHRSMQPLWKLCPHGSIKVTQCWPAVAGPASEVHKRGALLTSLRPWRQIAQSMPSGAGEPTQLSESQGMATSSRLRESHARLPLPYAWRQSCAAALLLAAITSASSPRIRSVGPDADCCICFELPSAQRPSFS
mmetsp:Transcript_58951/g.116783  ORF Transcript_58951/g.116783 Transcript_58951/m.116783 type:complete len:179 (-) Transcript_58951:231-767(-)